MKIMMEAFPNVRAADVGCRAACRDVGCRNGDTGVGASEYCFFYSAYDQVIHDVALQNYPLFFASTVRIGRSGWATYIMVI
jgi:deoxyxylulose-5-phosphate synthase